MRRAVLVACLAGCTGSVPSGPGTPTDAAVDDNGIDARVILWPDAASGSASTLPCKTTISPAPTGGHHNPGRSCFQSCHNHGFTLAGTLYTNSTGNTGFAGATISVIDANGQGMDLVVNSNGNFFTKQAISFPLLTFASACPSAVKMEGSTPSGDCNKSGCHVGGTSMQMHLP